MGKDKPLQKDGKIMCTKCNATFDSDYKNKHVEKHHPSLFKEGKISAAVEVLESTQPTLSSFFLPAPSKRSTSNKATKDYEMQILDNQPTEGISVNFVEVTQVEQDEPQQVASPSKNISDVPHTIPSSNEYLE